MRPKLTDVPKLLTDALVSIAKSLFVSRFIVYAFKEPFPPELLISSEANALVAVM